MERNNKMEQIRMDFGTLDHDNWFDFWCDCDDHRKHRHYRDTSLNRYHCSKGFKDPGYVCSDCGHITYVCWFTQYDVNFMSGFMRTLTACGWTHTDYCAYKWHINFLRVAMSGIQRTLNRFGRKPLNGKRDM